MANPSAYLVLCPDEFLLGVKVSEILDTLVPEENRMFGLETVDCSGDTVDSVLKAFSAVRGALVQQGFFSATKTVWMRDVAFLDSKRLAKSEAANNAIAEFCEWISKNGLPPETTLLVSSTSVPKGSKFYKAFAALEKQGAASIVNVPPPDSKSAASLVIDAGKILGYSIPRPVAAEIVARVGATPRLLCKEVEKLYLYTAGETPTAADVEAICTTNPEGEFWDLTTAFGNRDIAKTIAVLRNLYEMRTEPIFLVMQLQSRLNELYLCCDAMRRKQMSSSGNWVPSMSPEEAEAVVGLGKFDFAAKNPWTIRNIVEQARKWSVGEVKRARTVMNTAHDRMVSISADTKGLLEIAIMDALRRD